MNREWVKTLWLLLGLMPAGLGLLSSTFSIWHWRWFWWLNGTCSLLSALMMLRGSVERKRTWIFLSVLVGGGLFLINVVLAFLAGCGFVLLG